MVQPIRPQPNDPVTLLFQAGAKPVSDVTRAGPVHERGMLVPRTVATREFIVPPGTPLTVLFIHSERLFRWPMVVEEVLPSTWVLASVREPGDGERREFVRADIPMQVRIREHGASDWRSFSARVEVSASGFCMTGLAARPAAETLDVELRAADGGAPVAGVATLIRCREHEDGSVSMACRFDAISSSDESRLTDLVFAAREATLRARLSA